MCNIKMKLWFKNKVYVLEKELIKVEGKATPEEHTFYKKH